MPITVETDGRTDVVDVTDRVAAAIPPVVTGVCTVFVAHTTAGLVVNEPERRLRGDLEAWLTDLVAGQGGWAHDEIDDNADAHLKAAALGSHVAVPVVDGALALGTWQAVLLVEGDGPRSRTLRVAVTPGDVVA